MINYLKEEKRLNLVAFLGFFAWLMLGTLFFMIPFYVIGPKVSGLSFIEYASNMELIIQHNYYPNAVANIFAIFVFIILFYQTIKLDLTNFKQKWIKCVLVIILGAIILYASTYLMNYIYYLLGFGEDDTSTNQQLIIDALNSPSKYMVIFFTVILAPVFEEIIFRKLFYNTLRMNTKLPAWAIVLIISVVFAGIHVISDIESLVFFPQYFVLAFIITGAYAITKENIFVSIGLHFINNLLAVLEILL